MSRSVYRYSNKTLVSQLYDVTLYVSDNILNKQPQSISSHLINLLHIHFSFSRDPARSATHNRSRGMLGIWWNYHAGTWQVRAGTSSIRFLLALFDSFSHRVCAIALQAECGAFKLLEDGLVCYSSACRHTRGGSFLSGLNESSYPTRNPIRYY